MYIIYMWQENLYTFDHYFGVGQRRADTGDTSPSKRDFAEDGGFLCPSGRVQIKYLQHYHIIILVFVSYIIFSFIFYLEIKYAKPKRGKTATGIWKDIVNIDDYTQTLRMEKCL